MTETEMLARTQRRLLYFKIAIGVAIAVVIFSLWRGCENGKRARLAEDKNSRLVDSISQKLSVDSANRQAERAYYEKVTAQQYDSIRAARSRLDAKSNSLSKTERAVASLLREREMLREMLPDETYIKVSPRYVGQCDTCFDLLKVQTEEANAYKAEANNLSNIMAELVAECDKELNKEKKYSDSVLSMARTFQGAYNHIAKINRLRNKIFLEGIVGGHPAAFIYGGSVNVLNKQENKTYGVQILQIGGRTAYVAKYGMLLSFKKR